MAITNKQVPTTTASAAYTATADTAVTVIYICNNTDSDGVVDVYVVPSGQTVGGNFKIYADLTIKAKDTYIIDTEKMILGNGDKIYIVSSDSSGHMIATISTIGL